MKGIKAKKIAAAAVVLLVGAGVAACSSQAPIWGCPKVMGKTACKSSNTCKSAVSGK